MKRIIFGIVFLVLGSVFCYSQNIKGQWEKDFNGAKLILIFYEDTMEAGVITPDGSRNFLGYKLEYFVSNDLLIIFDYGTGVYAEPLRFECYINGNSLALIALNTHAKISYMDGKYTRRR